MLATIVLRVIMLFQKVDNISGMIRSLQTGIKGVTPSVLVHCSPLSETTVLSSLGSDCDHMDHVKTQKLYIYIVF